MISTVRPPPSHRRPPIGSLRLLRAPLSRPLCRPTCKVSGDQAELTSTGGTEPWQKRRRSERRPSSAPCSCVTWGECLTLAGLSVLLPDPQFCWRDSPFVASGHVRGRGRASPRGAARGPARGLAHRRRPRKREAELESSSQTSQIPPFTRRARAGQRSPLCPHCPDNCFASLVCVIISSAIMCLFESKSGSVRLRRAMNPAKEPPPSAVRAEAAVGRVCLGPSHRRGCRGQRRPLSGECPPSPRRFPGERSGKALIRLLARGPESAPGRAQSPCLTCARTPAQRTGPREQAAAWWGRSFQRPRVLCLARHHVVARALGGRSLLQTRQLRLAESAGGQVTPSPCSQPVCC